METDAWPECPDERDPNATGMYVPIDVRIRTAEVTQSAAQADMAGQFDRLLRECQSRYDSIVNGILKILDRRIKEADATYLFNRLETRNQVESDYQSTLVQIAPYGIIPGPASAAAIEDRPPPVPLAGNTVIPAVPIHVWQQMTAAAQQRLAQEQGDAATGIPATPAAVSLPASVAMPAVNAASTAQIDSHVKSLGDLLTALGGAAAGPSGNAAVNVGTNILNTIVNPQNTIVGGGPINLANIVANPQQLINTLALLPADGMRAFLIELINLLCRLARPILGAWAEDCSQLTIENLFARRQALERQSTSP